MAIADGCVEIQNVPRELPLSMSAAADRFAELSGRRLNVATVYKWATHGVRGLKLESLVIGGRRVTTAAAIERFVLATSGAGSKGGAA